MAKYSEKFKIKLVTEFLDGNIGYGSLAKKYNMGIYGKHRSFLFRYGCSLQVEQPILNCTLEKGI